MQLHVKHRAATGWREIVSPTNSASVELEFALVTLPAGENADAVHLGRESVLVVLSGTCAIDIEGMAGWKNLGSRSDVFSGRATAVYVPPDVSYRVSAATDLEMAVCRAPAVQGGNAFLVPPEEIRSRIVGSESWRREVHDIVDESRPAQRLIVGETWNEPGSWSSYPPHKHDVHDPPNEVSLQEIYHYRLHPPEGFGLQRIYSPERSFDQTFAVEHGDTAVIPFGYHPLVAAGGYRLYYLWFLAGEGRALRPHEDPMHGWVNSRLT